MTKPISLLAALALTLAGGAALAHDYTVGPLKIGHPWTRATPAGAKVAGGYLSVRNTGADADRLVGATSEIAGRVEVHEMAVKDGVMTMRPLNDGLPVKAGETVELKPGGLHIMFLDLKRQLKEGEKVKGQLRFEKAGTVDVDFAVQSVGAREGGHAGHGGGDAGHKH
ncbi:copper chaperone PCu(A)C [Bosea sp. TWI1241]|uniref:copper chaperone PCu(A)C n=1 Tax=Bosea sp. TWI1241 TaxID=3148904 RepID=UPI00320AF828